MSCCVLLGELHVVLFIYLKGGVVDILPSFTAVILTNSDLHSFTYLMVLNCLFCFLTSIFYVFVLSWLSWLEGNVNHSDFFSFAITK